MTSGARSSLAWLCRPNLAHLHSRQDAAVAAAARAPAWPRDHPAQYVALRAALAAGPASPSELARRFTRAPRARITTMLGTLAALGQARETGGRYSA